MNRAVTVRGALRGAVGAMAMTGMRQFTGDLGIVQRAPPQSMAREKAPGLLRAIPGDNERAAEEVLHWLYGAGGGAAFGALPGPIRGRVWAGPIYGVAVWLGFELGVAPVLGLAHVEHATVRARVALAVDHLLYGFVLSDPHPGS